MAQLEHTAGWNQGSFAIFAYDILYSHGIPHNHIVIPRKWSMWVVKTYGFIKFQVFCLENL